MTIRVEEYLRENGHCPFGAWFEGLSAMHAAKVAVALMRLSQGNTSSIKWFDGLGELRIDWGPGLRAYLAKTGDSLVVLFGGGSKGTQRRDVAEAKALLMEFRARSRTERSIGRRR